MKARLVKYSKTGWQWEIYSRNGIVICGSWKLYPSRKTAKNSLDNFICQCPTVSYRVPILNLEE